MAFLYSLHDWKKTVNGTPSLLLHDPSVVSQSIQSSPVVLLYSVYKEKKIRQ